MLALARNRLSDWHWLVFFAAILAAWAALFAMQLPAELVRNARLFGPEFWIGLCRVEPGLAGYPTTLMMWALMGAAMMAPGFVPALATFDDLAGSGAASRRGFVGLLGGYLSVWSGFAVLAAGLQVMLAGSAMLSPLGQSLSPWLTAFLLIAAGAYQFSSLKAACLNKCSAPFAFFMTYWRETRTNAVWLGLRLGALCLGCCWALMLLGFVGGTMNLLWMGAATVLMALEKLPQVSRYVVRPLGVVLVFGGMGVAMRAVMHLPSLRFVEHHQFRHECGVG